MGDDCSAPRPPPNSGCRDLERKHAQDRELWKKDTAAAVKAAREEMMALVGRS